MNLKPNPTLPAVVPRLDQRLTAALAAILVAVLASAGAYAQTETDCVGFQQHSIKEGGTNGASSVHAADLDGDGNMDIISASSNDDTIAWYRNNGGKPDPGVGELGLAFDRRVITTSADGVTSVYAADVDGDLDLDVLAASANDNTIALYENVGVGNSVTFVRQSITASARRALSVFAADVDGDTDLDVLSASFTDNTIAWYENPQIENTPLNPGGGNFGFTKRFVSTNAVNASSVYAINLDGENDSDGDNDIDVLSASIGDDKIAWYENRGVNVEDPDAPFIEFTEHVVTTEADGARSVFAADLDTDGDIDIISASISDDTVAWYENAGVLTEDGHTFPKFTKNVISSTADGAKSVFAADLDGDTDLDILVAAEQAGIIYWYENKGGAAPFMDPASVHTISTDVASADAVFAIDVDGDGPIDVLSASSVLTGPDNDKVAWYWNSPGTPPAWTEFVVETTAEGLNALFLADIDGDSEDDLVAATTTDQIVWYKIEGGADPAFNRNLVADGVLDARSVFAYDMDGDTDLDIISASAANDRILWHVNPRLTPARKRGGAPLEFTTTHVIAVGVDSVESIFVMDLNGDGYGDVLSASSGDDTVAWYENPCNGGCPDPPDFTEHLIATGDDPAIPFRTLEPRSVFAANLDDDPDIEVLTASAGDDKISIFKSNGETPPTFNVERIIASADPFESIFREEGASSVSATDVDNDGDMDLLVAASGAARISWYEREVDPDNAALFRYTRHLINQAAPGAAFVGFADVDDDGDPDVLATSLTDDRVLWHENRLEDFDPEADPEDTLRFVRHFVNFDGLNPRSVVTANVNDDDDDLDMLVGFRFGSSWFERVGEQCVDFDVDGANGDMVINGLELAWIGRAFGLSSDTPESEWWFEADFNLDGFVDGMDLAILSTPGVWGESTAIVDGAAECSYTCQ